MTPAQLSMKRENRTTAKFNSGTELINAVKQRREEAQQYWALVAQAEKDSELNFERFDPDVIDGVRINWAKPGVRAERNNTAFLHALKTGHRLRRAGEVLTEDKIIDAFDHAYAVAQRIGADGRKTELPSLKSRKLLAQRVRSYVLDKHYRKPIIPYVGMEPDWLSESDRKALSTMGRKGGIKAAERWKDRDSDYAKAALKPLYAKHEQRRAEGRMTCSKIQMFINQHYLETGKVPTLTEIMEDVRCSRATLYRHLATLKQAGLIPT